MDMIRKMEELFLSLRNKLPYSLELVSFDEYYKLKDNKNRFYRLIPLTEKDYKIYYSLYKSKFVISPIFELKHQNSFYVLYYEPINKGECLVVSKRIIELLLNIFNEYKYSLTLKRSNIYLMNNLYKVLDNKFTYFEMRIREIEVKPIKDDNDWVILTKYHILLDAKIYLYDLQDDLFKLIDKNEEVDYGLIYRNIDYNLILDDKLYPDNNLYYGPIGMLYARMYLAFNHILNIDFYKEKIDKLSAFNKKYFFFITLYIYILNLNLDVNINYKNIHNYISITKYISILISNFKDYAK